MAPDGPDPAVDEDEPTLDDLCRVMGDPHRRVALYFLVEHERASVAELADVVTGWTHAIDGTVATREDRERLSLALETVHLATMEAANVLTVDREDDVVTLADIPSAYSSFVRWSATVENSAPPT